MSIDLQSLAGGSKGLGKSGAVTAGVIALRTGKERGTSVCLVQEHDGSLGFPRSNSNSCEWSIMDTALRAWHEECGLNTKGLVGLERADMLRDHDQCWYYVTEWDETFCKIPEGQVWAVRSNQRATWMDVGRALAHPRLAGQWKDLLERSLECLQPRRPPTWQCGGFDGDVQTWSGDAAAGPPWRPTSKGDVVGKGDNSKRDGFKGGGKGGKGSDVFQGLPMRSYNKGEGAGKGDGFKGDGFKGDGFKGNGFKGDSFKGDSFKGDSFRGDSFKGGSFKGDTFKGSDWFKGDGLRGIKGGTGVELPKGGKGDGSNQLRAQMRALSYRAAGIIALRGSPPHQRACLVEWDDGRLNFPEGLISDCDGSILEAALRQWRENSGLSNSFLWRTQAEDLSIVAGYRECCYLIAEWPQSQYDDGSRAESWPVRSSGGKGGKRPLRAHWILIERALTNSALSLDLKELLRSAQKRLAACGSGVRSSLNKDWAPPNSGRRSEGNDSAKKGRGPVVDPKGGGKGKEPKGGGKAGHSAGKAMDAERGDKAMETKGSCKASRGPGLLAGKAADSKGGGKTAGGLPAVRGVQELRLPGSAMAAPQNPLGRQKAELPWTARPSVGSWLMPARRVVGPRLGTLPALVPGVHCFVPSEPVEEQEETRDTGGYPPEQEGEDGGHEREEQPAEEASDTNGATAPGPPGALAGQGSVMQRPLEKLAEQGAATQGLQEQGATTQGPPEKAADAALTDAAESELTFVVVLDKRDGMKLGIEIDSSEGSRLCIEAVAPDGLFHSWNEANCHRGETGVIEPLDRIIRVNSASDDAGQMIEQMRQNQLLEFTILRYSKDSRQASEGSRKGRGAVASKAAPPKAPPVQPMPALRQTVLPPNAIIA